MAPRPVTCCVCGVLWNPADNGVAYRSLDNRWWCVNFVACKQRHEFTLLSEQRKEAET